MAETTNVNINVNALSGKAQQSFNKLGTSMKKTGVDSEKLRMNMLKMTAGITAIAYGAKKAIDAYSQQINAVNSLSLAMANQGNYSKEAVNRLQEYASEMQRLTTYGDELTLSNMGILASFGMNEEQLKSTTTAAMDFASATGKDLRVAVDLLGKAFVGETSALSRYGIIVDKNIPKSEKFAEVMRQMTARFGGAAQLQAATMAGKIEQIGNAAGDVQEQLGKLFGFMGDWGGQQNFIVSALEWLGRFLGKDLILTIGWLRMAFSKLFGYLLKGWANVLDWMTKGLQMLPIIGEKYKKTIASMKDFAQGAIDAGDALMEQAAATAHANVETADFNATQAAAARAASETATKVKTATVELIKYDTVLKRTGVDLSKFTPQVQQMGVEFLETSTISTNAMMDILKTTPQVQTGIEDLGDSSTDFSDTWSSSLGDAADIMRIFEGSVAESISRIIGYMSAGGAAGRQMVAGIRQGGVAGYTSAAVGAAQGAGALWAATDPRQGRVGGTAGGAVTGASIGAAAGPWGAAVGAIVGGLIGFFRGRRERKLIEKVGEDYGIWMTQAMAKSVTDKAKELGIADELATLLFTGEMFRAGMVPMESFGKMFTDLMTGVKEGTIPAKEGLEAISDAFFAMVEAAGAMGDAGVFHIGRMVNEMREMGMMTQEVAQQVAQWVGEGISRLGDYFGYLAEQTEITGEQANAAVQLLAAGFAAAIEQTGSLYAAIMSLPEGFGALIERLGEMIGTENEAFLRMQELYNFIQDNEATLGAIAALGDALRAFGMAGILTAADVEALGTSMGAEFQRLIDSGADLTSIIAAVGPELAMLYRAYKELGMDVPPWLQGIAEDLEGMEPPRDTATILGSIEEAIWAIAKALGAAVGEAEDLGTAIGDIPDTPRGGRGGGNGDGNGDGRGHQRGAIIPARPGGARVTVGEGGEAELIAPVRAFSRQLASDIGRQMGGGGTITVNLMLDRKVLAKEVVRSVNEGQRHGYIDPTGEGAETR